MRVSSGVIHGPQKVVIYGPEGIGKSTFASKFPGAIFCDTEGSTKKLNVMRLERPTSAEMLYECIDYVAAHRSEYSTFVLDTADWAEKLLTKDVCAKAKKTGIEDFGYGKGFTYLSEEFGRLLNRLEDLIGYGINVVVTAHAQLQKFEQPDESGSYDRWTLKLTKQDSSLLKEWADAVLFVNYKTFVEKVKDKKYKATGGKRTMYTVHHSCWDAKNRWGLPEEVDFDYSIISPHIMGLRAEPQETPTVEPAAPAAPPERSSIDAGYPNIPKALSDLMILNKVTPEDIRLAVSQAGYYPRETKIEDYDPDFINGVLIGAWKQVYDKILCNNDLPFN